MHHQIGREDPLLSPRSAIRWSLTGKHDGWGSFGTPTGKQAALIALTIYLIGVGGSLVLAAIKADRGVKNWGHLIPGQGGFVDQMDSVVFAAPIFYHLARYFGAS